MDGLGMADNLRFHHRNWIFERVGWVVLGSIALAALFGLFGPGVLGPTLAVTPTGSLSVEYPHFARMQSPLSLRIRFASAPGQRHARLRVDHRYIEGISVEHVTPEPDSVQLDAGGLTYRFALGGAAGENLITFRIEADRPGRVRGRIGLIDADGTTEVGLDQFFYP